MGIEEGSSGGETASGLAGGVPSAVRKALAPAAAADVLAVRGEARAHDLVAVAVEVEQLPARRPFGERGGVSRRRGWLAEPHPTIRPPLLRMASTSCTGASASVKAQAEGTRDEKKGG